MISNSVINTLANAGWFNEPGAYVLVDGQYGSTGKGLFAHALAEYGTDAVNCVTTNAGPNSGHTAIMDDDTSVMTQQIPIMSAIAGLEWNAPPITYLNGGAVIDPQILLREMKWYGVVPLVHGSAAVISDATNKMFSNDSLNAIASTGKGVGQAMAAKVLRTEQTARYCTELEDSVVFSEGNYTTWKNDWVVFVETAQGYSLGINSGFYPHTTSRECTVAQALADAGIAPQRLRNVVMTLRTFPIRVGNTANGYSGPCYGDQEETTWDAIGQKPELTSVTKRVRRVFTWSRNQFIAAVQANRPDTLFLNFCNYLDKAALEELLHIIMVDYYNVMNDQPRAMLLGFGPKTSDIKTLEEANVRI